MAWLTRAPTGSVVQLSPSSGPYNYPVGVELSDGRVRAWYGPSWAGSQASKTSADDGATWQAATSFHCGVFNAVGEEAGISNVRRGNLNGAHPDRLHAAVSISQWYKDATYGTGGARACLASEVNYPTAAGNMIVYEPYYGYSDDDGDTWTTEAVPYSGAAGAAMDVNELSNGDVIVTWYGNGTAITPPYTGKTVPPAYYPDSLCSRRDHTTGTWSIVGTIGTNAGYGGAVDEAIHDVIHDGTTYGKIVGIVTAPDPGGVTNKLKIVSTDGGSTWTVGPVVTTAVNTARFTFTKDGDGILSYFKSSYAGPAYRVTQDGGATFSAEVTLHTSSGDRWVTPVPYGRSGVSPNVMMFWAGGSSDFTGTAYARPLSRGSDVLISETPAAGYGNTVSSGYGTATAEGVPGSLLVLPSSSAWEQVGTSIFVRTTNAASSVLATVTGSSGGLLRFQGANADLFDASLDGTTWASMVDIPVGNSTVYLRVTPVTPGSTLAAQVGVPV